MEAKLESDQSVLKVMDGDVLLAIVVRGDYNNPGRAFFTPNEFPFQLGMHIRGPEDYIPPHAHNPFEELKMLPVQEFFLMLEGKIEVGLYNEQTRRHHMRLVLGPGDMLVLNCPHDVKFLEQSKFIELKQGPYRGKDAEKKFFQPK